MNIGPDAPQGAVPFILPGPIADRETVAGWRVAMMKINHPLVPPTARSAQRGVPRRATSAAWFSGLPARFHYACRRHGLAARASIRQSRQTELLSVTPNYALFGDDTHRLEDLSGD